MIAHAFNPSTWEAEAGIFLCVWVQPDLHVKIQDNWDCIEKPCFKNTYIYIYTISLIYVNIW